MKNTKVIDKLLLDRKWVPINSIIFPDGKMILLDIFFIPQNKYFIGPIADSSIESYLKYNKDLSDFDIQSTIQKGQYEINVGSAVAEEEGFVYVIDLEKSCLIWFAFFQYSDPFTSVTVNDKNEISAVTKEGIPWIIPIDDPLSMSIIYPENE